MFKSLERSTRLQRTLALSLFLFRTHFITLAIFSRLLLCVSVFALQYIVWFFFYQEFSSLLYSFFLIFLHSLFNHDTMCTIKMNSARLFLS